MITADRLRELVAYDGETGVFAWRVKRGNGLRIGDVAGRVGQGYRMVRIEGRGYLAHRLAWLWVHGNWPVGEIDHINGDKLDNRIANLRDIDRRGNKENMREARSDSLSGLLGVTTRKRGRSVRFVASIRVEGKLSHIGSFGTPEAAHAAYVERKRQVHAACTI